LDAYSQPNVALAIWKPTRLFGMDWERAMASRNQNYTFCSASILSNHSNLPSSTPRHRVRKAGSVGTSLVGTFEIAEADGISAASIVKTEETLVNMPRTSSRRCCPQNSRPWRHTHNRSTAFCARSQFRHRLGPKVDGYTPPSLHWMTRLAMGEPTCKRKDPCLKDRAR